MQAIIKVGLGQRWHRPPLFYDLRGWALREQSLGCPAGPVFPEGAGEPSSCTGVTLSESLGFTADFSVVSIPSTPKPLLPLPVPHIPPPQLHPTQATARSLSGGIRWVGGKKCSHVFLRNKIKCVCRCSVFYKLSSLVVIRLKQFSPSVNASLQNH